MSRVKRENEKRVHVFIPDFLHEKFTEVSKREQFSLQDGVVLAMANQIKVWEGETPVMINKSKPFRKILGLD